MGSNPYAGTGRPPFGSLEELFPDAGEPFTNARPEARRAAGRAAVPQPAVLAAAGMDVATLAGQWGPHGYWSEAADPKNAFTDRTMSVATISK
jgi:hypothetical protein